MWNILIVLFKYVNYGLLNTQQKYSDLEKELRGLYRSQFCWVSEEMGRACSMNWGEEQWIYDICGKARKEENTTKTKTLVGG
jgi:hypothetical protein